MKKKIRIFCERLGAKFEDSSGGEDIHVKCKFPDLAGVGVDIERKGEKPSTRINVSRFRKHGTLEIESTTVRILPQKVNVRSAAVIGKDEETGKDVSWASFGGQSKELEFKFDKKKKDLIVHF